MTNDGSLQQELSAFFGADPTAIAWPYPLYSRLREGSGVVRWHGGPATVVTHHADVKSVMSGDHPIHQNAYRHGEMAQATVDRLHAELKQLFYEVLDFESLFMSRQEGEDHRRLRRVAQRVFTARRVEALRSSIQGHVDDLVAGMLNEPEPDMKRHLADRLPVRVIIDLIGVDQQDGSMIWQWSEAIARAFSLDTESLQAAHAAIASFKDYVGAAADQVRRTGEGPELARLLLDSHEGAALSDDELVAMYLLLLFGGSETTTNLLGNGFLALQRHREQWETLVESPDLLRPAIDELLRYDTPHHYLPRVVHEEFELGGHTFRPDETLIVIMGAANRDPERFDDPDTLDITRSNASDHLSFAFGPHYCLGASLAKLEAEVVFSTLIERVPGIRLKDVPITYGGSAMLRAITSLPVVV
jgi:cytochrome P450